MEVVRHEKKKFLWELVDYHVVEEPTDHEEIVIWGFDFNVFNKYEEGVVREGSSEFPYLLMIIFFLWAGLHDPIACSLLGGGNPYQNSGYKITRVCPS